MNRGGLAEYLKRFIHPGGLMICPSLRFIYMKPGKTAGTTMMRTGLWRVHDHILTHKHHFGEWSHFLDTVTDEELQEYYIFATVRNPRERLISACAYFHIDVDDFLESPLSHIWRRPRLMQHTVPLRNYCYMQKRRFADAVIRTDHMQRDYDMVCERIGISGKKLDVRNKSTRKALKDVWTGWHEERFLEMYVDDLAWCNIEWRMD